MQEIKSGFQFLSTDEDEEENEDSLPLVPSRFEEINFPYPSFTEWYENLNVAVKFALFFMVMVFSTVFMGL